MFQAGSTLTTASGSHVNLVNGAQACNVYWQIGSSATLGSASVFTGNILALTSISLNNGVTVQGRTLARNGSVTLINDTITAAQCATGGTGGTGGGTGGTGGGTGGAGGTGGTGAGTGSHAGTSVLGTTPSAVERTVHRFGVGRCVQRTFRVTVRGHLIRRVVFSVGHRVVATRTRTPWTAIVPEGNGIRIVRARVTFKDNTAAKTLQLRFRACAAALRPVGTPPSRPPGGGGGFTG